MSDNHADLPTKADIRFDLSPEIIGPVFQLPQQVRDKWQIPDSAEAENGAKDIDPDLREADSAVLQQDCNSRYAQEKCSNGKSGGRCPTWEERLASAESNRQFSLEERRLKASAVTVRVNEAVERVTGRLNAVATRTDVALQAAEERRLASCSERTERLSARGNQLNKQREYIARTMELRNRELGEQLHARLEQADALREAQLAETAEKAGEVVAKARRRQAEQRERDAEEAQQKLAHLEARLNRAALSRQARRTIPQLAGQKHLARRAAEVARLRRHHCARKLQRAWRSFVAGSRTTRHFALAFVRTGVPKIATRGSSHDSADSAGVDMPTAVASTPPLTPVASPVPDKSFLTPESPGFAIIGLGSPSGSLTPDKERHVSFERMVATIQSKKTLQCTERLLRRLSEKLALRCSDVMSDVSGLMRRLYPKAYQQADRYTPRVFLCAYMILSHPEVVFNQRGDREAALTAAAQDMVDAFSVLLERLIEPASGAALASRCQAAPCQGGSEENGAQSTAILLASFDEAWVAYLEQFVAWKFADAASLEAELIRAAAGLEKSMLAKLGATEPNQVLSSDMQAVIDQVAHDHALLRERIQRLGGSQGLVRLEAALNLARAQVAAAAEAQQEKQQSLEKEKRDGPTPSVSPMRRSMALKSPGTPGVLRPPTPETHRGANINSNEGMVWELLYDNNWQLPSAAMDVLWTDALGETDPMTESVPAGESMGEAEANVWLQERVVRIAERAFWDSFVENLLDGSQQKPAAQVAEILGDLGSQLANVLPEEAPVAAQLRADLEPSRLEEALAVKQEQGKGTEGLQGLDSQHLLSTLGHAAGLLRQLGAPERESAALQAQAVVARRLEVALASSNQKDLALATAQALRLLTAQLRLLRRDATNFRLRVLARSLAGSAGLNYSRDKFITAWGIRQDMPMDELTALLPRTRGVLAMASGTLPAIEHRLLDTAAGQNGDGAMNSSSNVPTTLRSGLRGPPSVGSSPSKSALNGAVAVLQRPVNLRSWNTLVRLGLIHVISADIPVSQASVPETLLLDLERLFRLQNEFGRIIVLAACLLVLQQSSIPQGRTSASLDTAKMRISSLLADPSIRLPGLAAELTQLAGGDVSDGDTESTILAGLNGLIRRSGPGYKALANGIVAALQLSVLSANASSSPTRSAIGAALSRCGASSLRAEVEELSDGLCKVAAISEAVHFDVYQRLSIDLL